jgi:galactose mutarotase-like enzyme
MENITLQHNSLLATIQLKGAELCSLQIEGIEYIWYANPTVWNRHAPILFPIVGRLKNNLYTYRQKNYTLPQHGFARDCHFRLVEHSVDTAILELASDQSTLSNFPFEFLLRVSYAIADSKLRITYLVQNPSSKNDLWFSIGAHPGFNCPLLPATEKFTDYVLDFGDSAMDEVELWKLENGLIAKERGKLISAKGQIALDYSLFKNDALIFSTDQVKRLRLQNIHSGKGVNMDFPDFDWVGVWTKGPGAPFVCLEPWCGIADTVDHDQELTTKLGINRLNPKGQFSKSFFIHFF